MSKNHYCKKYNSDFVICGETDPEKFSNGRYSICKNCQKLSIYELRKKKKETKDIEEEKLIDPDSKINKIFENKINKLPIYEGKTVKEVISESYIKISEINETSHIFNVKKKDLNENFTKLYTMYTDLNKKLEISSIETKKYFEELTERNQILKNENDILHNKLLLLQGRIESMEKINKGDYYKNISNLSK
jgi:hypothetical protein